HIMYWPLSQIMIDAEDRLLVESTEQNLVEDLCRGEVPAEGLFNNDARAVGTTRLGQLLHDQPEQYGRDGKVMCRSLGGTEFFAEGLEGCRVLIVAINIAQQAA